MLFAGTLTSMGNLANMLWQMNGRQHTLRLMQATADTLGRTIGEDHPNTRDALDVLAQWRAALAPK